MMPTRKHVLALAFLTVILLHSGPTFSQTFYNLGDANSDGWCNFADVYAITGYFQGDFCGNFCITGADANGNGIVNAIDVTYLVAFLRGGGAAPIGSCPCPVMTCDPNETAYIELAQYPDANPVTATFRVTISSSALLSNLNFSIIYDPAQITGFSANNVLAPNNVIISAIPRLYVTPYEIVAITFDCFTSGVGGSFPTPTAVFDLEITSVPQLPDIALKIVENDPIYGPPRFFFGETGMSFGCGSIFPFTPWQWLGDVNGSGSVNGIDITFLLNYLKGGAKPIGKYFWNLPCDWDY